MTPTECCDLVDFIADRCPAMKVREGTAASWFIDLVEFDLQDAMVGAHDATLDKAFISIGDLVNACHAVVRKRLGAERKAKLDEEFERETGQPRELFTTSQAQLTGGPSPEVARALVLVKRAPSADYAPGTASRLMQDALAEAARERVAREREQAEREATERAEHDAGREQADRELEALKAAYEARLREQGETA